MSKDELVGDLIVLINISDNMCDDYINLSHKLLVIDDYYLREMSLAVFEECVIRYVDVRLFLIIDYALQ